MKAMGEKSRHRKKTSHSKKKVIFMMKIGTVLVAVILTVLLGVFIPKSMNKKSATIEMTKDYKPGEDINSSLKKNEEIEKLIDGETPKDNGVKVDIKSLQITKDPVLADITDENLATTNSNKEVIENAKSTVTKDIEKTPVDSDKDNTAQTPVKETNEKPTADETQYVKDGWVDDIIHDNQDSIDNQELAAGAAIYNKLDTGYLFGLADGGLTVEERAEAMLYLETNLSAEEYALAKALFNKYIGLAN